MKQSTAQRFTTQSYAGHHLPGSPLARLLVFLGVHEDHVADFEVSQLAGLTVVDVLGLGLELKDLGVSELGLVEDKLVGSDLLYHTVEITLEGPGRGRRISKASRARLRRLVLLGQNPCQED